MKRHSLFTEIIIFSAIFLSVILPSVISQVNFTNENIFSQWSFNPFIFVTLIIGILIIFFFYEKQKHQNILVNLIMPSTFIFCVLFFFSLIFKFISAVMPAVNTETELTVELPQSFLQWLFCILQFSVAAFYEEIIYRFYIPETLNTWISSKSSKKIFLIISEIFVMICFASAHFYMGILAVLNACIAHFVFRFAFKKTKSLVPNVIAHFLYNIISLILL